MKKIFGLIIMVLIMTGCSGNYNITIDNDKITENVIVTASTDEEYSRIKNWNGFPLTLYYDQDLENPFGAKREKETGVPYYINSSDDSSKTTTAKGVFSINDFSRSSLVRGCFKYFQVLRNGSIVTFSTSKGLICDFSNFNVVVDTEYMVLNSNADSSNAETNTFTWNFAKNSNKSVYLEVDFSKKFNEKDENNSTQNPEENKENRRLSITILIGALITVSIILILLFRKKRNSDSI